jgi:hypothetical protein
MTDENEPGEVPPKEFALFLIDRAATHQELSTKLNALVPAVQDTGKKGSITVTFEFDLFDGDPNRIVVKDKITLKMPEHDRKNSIFFPDKDGNLSRTDPNQLNPEMFKDYDPQTGAFREPGQAAGQ